MKCVNCGSENLHEENSELMGSVVACENCGCRTSFGASGVPPTQHPAAPPPDKIAEEAKKKVEENKKNGVKDIEMDMGKALEEAKEKDLKRVHWENLAKEKLEAEDVRLRKDLGKEIEFWVDGNVMTIPKENLEPGDNKDTEKRDE